jgi:hypothetical protein
VSKKNGMPCKMWFSSINDLTDCAMSCPVDYADALQWTRWFPIRLFVSFSSCLHFFFSFSLTVIFFCVHAEDCSIVLFCEHEERKKEILFVAFLLSLSSSPLCASVCMYVVCSVSLIVIHRQRMGRDHHHCLEQ